MTCARGSIPQTQTAPDHLDTGGKNILAVSIWHSRTRKTCIFLEYLTFYTISRKDNCQTFNCHFPCAKIKHIYNIYTIPPGAKRTGEMVLLSEAIGAFDKVIVPKTGESVMEKGLLQNFSFLRHAPVCPVSFSSLYTQTYCAMNNARNPYFPISVSYFNTPVSGKSASCATARKIFFGNFSA